jgi:hypothetical protein
VERAVGVEFLESCDTLDAFPLPLLEMTAGESWACLLEVGLIS